MEERKVICGLDPEMLSLNLSSAGAEERYSRRLLYWVYRRGIRSFSEPDDIPVSVKSALEERFLTGVNPPISSVRSADGSVKYLFETAAGLPHETVWLPEGKRMTVCVSVQSGCRMGCSFCATGRSGWSGNLMAGEIVNQVVGLPNPFTHIVLMGMGEPGDNIDEVIRACRIFTAEWGLAAGRSKVTVSTVGVTPSVIRLLNETEVNITLSLHSPFPDEREEVIPAERQWPFTETLKLMKEYDNVRRRRFTVAYVMIKGNNDTGRHLEELRRLLHGTGIRVNLLPYHSLPGDPEESADEETMMQFRHLLVTSGVGASVRRSRGADIAAACGMLAAGGTPRQRRG
ncbi:MAG: 23S rRNA (adenine(2503)-C(2))-methyltransferase RlmN [Bacteroidales bacterium]|nr:23S rRNA (adenine(2503)-C(2))-methyltransferase RlmN [Bacteroidales bacterium]MDT8374594.1 23S rRNA (adenine(2503)-C(2))-methyltransferase RlmN [Bacteroidales bacterium]